MLLTSLQALDGEKSYPALALDDGEVFLDLFDKWSLIAGNATDPILHHATPLWIVPHCGERGSRAAIP